MHGYLLLDPVRGVYRCVGGYCCVRLQERGSSAADPAHRLDESQVRRGQFSAEQALLSLPRSHQVRGLNSAPERLSHHTSVRGRVSAGELPAKPVHGPGRL